jgi:hypothetical protein
MLIASGFAVAKNYAKHDTAPVGTVYAQTPGSSSTPGCGTTVTIDISLGPCTLSDLTGMTKAAAKAQIVTDGFTVGTVSYVNANGGTPLGDVNSQSPAPGVQPCGSAVDIGVSSKCIDPNAPFHTEWVAWGEPDCWCYERNCRGDADGVKAGPYWVAIKELNLLRSSINKIDALLLPVNYLGTAGICMDADHKKAGPYRVAIPDLNILRSYINKLEPPFVPACPKDWDALGPVVDDYHFWCAPGGVCP